MKLDKNTVIGFVLMGILMFAYFWNANKQAKEFQAFEQHKTDSLAKINNEKNRIADSLKATIATKPDSANGKPVAIAKLTTEQTTTIENDVIKVTLTNKGGRVKFAELKKYKSFDGTAVKLGTANDRLGYNINTSNTSAASTNDLFFTAGNIVTNKDGSQSITYSYSQIDSQAVKPVTHTFTIKPASYLIDWDINLQNTTTLLTNSQLNFAWNSSTTQHEKSASYERQQMSNICFYEGDDFDYISSKTQHKFEKPTNWMSVVQQFFNTTLVAKNNFTGGDVNWAQHCR